MLYFSQCYNVEEIAMPIFYTKKFSRPASWRWPLQGVGLVDKLKKVITSPDLLLLEVRFTVTVSPNHQESGAMVGTSCTSIRHELTLFILVTYTLGIKKNFGVKLGNAVKARNPGKCRCAANCSARVLKLLI